MTYTLAPTSGHMPQCICRSFTCTTHKTLHQACKADCTTYPVHSQPGCIAACAAGIFAETFTRLQARNVVPKVLYPAVQLPSQSAQQASQQQWQSLVTPQLAAFMQAGPLFVSINRFERKKVWLALPKSFGSAASSALHQVTSLSVFAHCILCADLVATEHS